MKNLVLAVGVLGLLGGFVGCGGDDLPPLIGDGGSRNTSGTGGKANKGGNDARGGEGGDQGGVAGTSDQGGEAGAGLGGEAVAPPVVGTPPDVAVTSPAPLTDPNAPGVLVANTVTVTCIAKRPAALDSSPVDPAKVVLAVLDAGGVVLQEKPGGVTANQNEYANDFVLTTVPGGKVGFQCRALDLDKRSGASTIYGLLDKGPNITIVSPLEGSAHPRQKQLLAVEFKVEAAELAPGDTGAEVGPVVLTLGGKNIAVTKSAVSAGLYTASVNLDDSAVFDPKPNGLFPVLIEATNKRSPVAVKNAKPYQILVDGQGPIVSVSHPLDKQVVGGNVKLVFTATDAGAGVDPSSVVALLDTARFPFDLTKGWTLDNKGNFTFEFDSRTITTSEVQATITIQVADRVGNKAPDETIPVFFDYVPPSVDLDPANIRTVSPQNECSVSFDPAGPLALSDLDKAATAGLFRAIVWDETNEVDGIDIRYYSGTNQGSVRLYVQANPAGAPLLVNKPNDTDPECDEIGIVPGTPLELKAVRKDGSPWYANETATPPTTASIGCAAKAGTRPKDLCTDEASDMWQVIEHTGGEGAEPVVYAHSPSAGLACTGVGWEFGSRVDRDGWICVAVRAEDNAGNVGVSRPIRLCIDEPAQPGQPACAISSTTPPACTDGCTPAKRWGGGPVGL